MEIKPILKKIWWVVFLIMLGFAIYFGINDFINWIATYD